MSLLSLYQNNIATPTSIPVVITTGIATGAEMYIENQPVDISADLSSLLTFAIDDVKDFATRQTTFSKTIVLPGTSRNNALFGNIFELGNANDYNPTTSNIGYNFNASKSASCIMFQDNMQTFKGSMRLLQINKDRGRIEYEVALNGSLTNLNVALSSGYLTDLDFSAYNQLWNETNIAASWDNPGGSGLYYPVIDYGVVSGTAKHDWDFRNLRPSLYVKEYIDKMFAAANFRYESAFLNTARFKGLIVPHNQKTLQALNTQLLFATRNNTADVINSGTSPVVPLQFSTTVTAIFTPSISNSRFTYTGIPSVNLLVNIEGTGNYISNVIGFSIYVAKNGVAIPGTSISVTADGTNTTRYYSYSKTDLSVSFATGDYIEIVFAASASYGTGSDRLKGTSFNFFIDSAIAVITPVSYGNSIQVNQTIPKNIKQIDFLVSIIKLFNLYIYEDKFDDRLIKISPFINFYSTDSSNAVDWTYKMNRDTIEQVKPLSELNSKTYKFSYKEDSDYYNDLYKKRYNQGYGSYIYDSQFEFASAQSALELIFASTPLVGYLGEDKIYPTIFKKNATTEEPTDSVIRILQTKKITGVSTWAIKAADGATTSGIYTGIGATTLGNYLVYGYAGHFDNPNNPTNDLNFGALKELFFTLVIGNLSVTQFNVYWSSYMAEITDKDSKLSTARYYLTAMDIFNLDFSKYVYVDGVLFRLNKITDYNTSNPNDCEVQLLKVINTIY